MFVSGANLDEMTAQVRQFNTIRAELGLPPDQPMTLFMSTPINPASLGQPRR